MALPVAALVAAGAASAAGSISSAYGNYKAAQAAARAQKEAAAENKAYATEVLAQQKALEQNSGYYSAGTNALSKLSALTSDDSTYAGYGDYTDSLSFDPSSVDVTQDPGYATRLKAGTTALDTSAGAKGSLFSGAQQKALLKYGQEQGSQEYDKAYNRQLTTFQDSRNAKYRDYLNRVQQYNQNLRNQVSDLGNLANYGENSVTRQQNALGNSVSAVTGANSAIGNANAASAGAGWSALSGAGSSLGSAVSDVAKTYALNNASSTTDTTNSSSIYG